ncbi:TPA: hypothetical protein L9K97_005095 [Klebsiella pneumoniae]|nr:hypothetical protein [Klebsiella pneumoniae]
MRYDEYASSLKLAVEKLDDSILFLVQDAANLLEEFWADVKARNQFAPFAFNIQKQGNSTYRIRWVAMYKPKPGNSTGFTRVKANHINKGKGDSYFLRQLTGCPVWFEVLFNKYEPQLTEIRKAIRQNRAVRGRLSKMVTEYGKMSN